MGENRIIFVQGSLDDVNRQLPASEEAARDDPSGMVDAAVDRARQMTSRAVNQIDAIWRVSNKKAALESAWKDNAAFCAYFGIDHVKKRQIRALRRRLLKVNQWIGRGLKIKVRPANGPRSGRCKKGGAGFNNRGKFGKRWINLCPVWFGVAKKWEIPPDDRRASIVAHEVAHSLADITGFGLWTVDLPKGGPKRGPKEAREFARTNPKRARHNPENFEHALLALMHPDHVTAEDD